MKKCNIGGLFGQNKGKKFNIYKFYEQKEYTLSIIKRGLSKINTSTKNDLVKTQEIGQLNNLVINKIK